MDLQAIYSALPIPLKQLAVAVRGYQYRRRRYGPVFRSHLHLLESSQYWPLNQFLDYQASELYRLIDEARAFTHAYRDLPRFSSSELRAMLEAHRFDGIPLLNKADFRSRLPLYRNLSRSAASTGRTSGTTGSPMRHERDLESLQRTFAYIAQQRAWVGLAPFSRSVRLSGKPIVPGRRSRPPFWMYNPAENQLLLSIYHLRHDTAESIRRKLLSYRPELLDGYPSAILELGALLGPHTRSLPLRAIITTAETLDDHTRERLRDIFNVPIVDYYAASEGVPLIQQCELGNYHIRPESGIFEVHDDQGNEVGPGEIGELVVTSFCNFRTPLIRYRTGDFVQKANAGERCECQRTLPVIKRIIGRKEDAIITRDGRRLTMFARVVTPVEGIELCQIIQESPDIFTFRIVRRTDTSPEQIERALRESIKERLGYLPQLKLDYVKEIPRGPNGKFRQVVRLFS